jgi:hypothetical protein
MIPAETWFWKGEKQMKKVLVAAVALTLVLSAVAFAGNNTAAKVAIHVRAHNAKLACALATPIEDCTGVVTTEPTFSVDAFPVFYDLVEFKGVEYGLCWPAWAYSAAFNNCADLVIGAIAWPGDGASHAWFECQYGVAVPSFVWLYADGPGMICPCPDPTTGLISVLDCAEGLDSPCGVFCAGVFGEVGDDPCDAGASATEQSTWGGIKSIFE